MYPFFIKIILQVIINDTKITITSEIHNNLFFFLLSLFNSNKDNMFFSDCFITTLCFSYSPANNSFNEIFSIEHNSFIIEASGKLIPLSHLETALVLTLNFQLIVFVSYFLFS
jgi:hypothetical protein